MKLMTDLIKPPTDNLYKFLAVSGLIILILSVVSPLIMSHELGLIKLETLKEVDVLEAQIRKLVNTQGPVKKAEELQIKLVETKANIKLLQYLQNEFSQVVIAAIVGGIVGSLLTVIGFRLWYVRLQLYQDLWVKNEAEAKANDKQILSPIDPLK